ncbi:MAG TPA: YceI family protein [Candidatus Eisenbacteria bacterium]|nr:YceI family protein [Candidatus Eisenbacteria bacterium]
MKSALVPTILIASMLAPARGACGEYAVHAGKECKVVFVSRAANEKFEGKTDRLEGRISVDPAALGDSATFRFEVDMASLDTGIKMRNRHMRENHLETSKFPKALFEGGSLHAASGARLEAGKPESLQVEGTFTLHGVSRRIRIAVAVTLRPDPSPGAIDFSTEFPVALADYAISRPQFLFLKLADVQMVRVSGTAHAAPR